MFSAFKHFSHLGLISPETDGGFVDPLAMLTEDNIPMQTEDNIVMETET